MGSKSVQRVGALLASVVLVVGTAPAAFAGSNGSLASTNGSTAKFFHDGDYFKICDTASDGHSVYVKFKYSGSGGELKLSWTGGADSCANRTYNIGEGKTVQYQSCVADTAWDTCSGWKEGVA